MRAQGYGAECEHGRLARKCERCADADEIASLRDCAKRYERWLAQDHATIADLRDRVRVLEEALEWYADESNYDSDHAPGMFEPNVPREYAGWDADCGERARAALAKGGE